MPPADVFQTEFLSYELSETSSTRSLTLTMNQAADAEGDTENFHREVYNKLVRRTEICLKNLKDMLFSENFKCNGFRACLS